jgi:hypothetical protein
MLCLCGALTSNVLYARLCMISEKHCSGLKVEYPDIKVIDVS